MSNRRVDQFDDRSAALKLFDTVWAIARRAGLENDPRTRRIMKMIVANPNDLKGNRQAAAPLLNLAMRSPDYLARQSDQNPFQPYPTVQVDGPIRLGKVENPHVKRPLPFGLLLHELNQNVLAFGRAGSGKTVLLLLLVANLIRLGLPFLVLDFKRDYRGLLRHCPKLLVFNWRNFKFNPLAPPPGVGPVYWLQTFVDIFFDAFFASPAMAAKSAFFDLLLEMDRDWQERYGAGVHPNLVDVELEIRRRIGNREGRPGSGVDRLRTIQSRLGPLVNALGPMLDCQEGYDIPALLTLPVVLELDGLTQENQNLLINALFFWIFTYRLNSAQRGEFRHALVFDEAKMVFARDRASGSSPISRLISTAREMGQACICADQMPSGLGHALLANVYATIGLNLSATKDIQEMAYAMNLNPEQRPWLGRMPLGMAVVKLADRFHHPFLIRIPPFPLDKNVGDEETERHMAPHLQRLSFIPPVRHSMGVRGSGQPAADSANESHSDPESDQKQDASRGMESSSLPLDLDERAFAYLMDVKSRPFLSKTERNGALGLSSYLGNRISGKLEAECLVQSICIAVGRRGRTAVFLELTEKASSVVGRQQLGPGKGGFEHIYHQQRIQRRFEVEGWKTTIEAFRDGKSVDVGLEKDGRGIAIEVAMSEPGELSNIEKDLAAGWGEVWEVCRDGKILAAVERQWLEREAAWPGAKVCFYLLNDARFDSAVRGTPKPSPGKEEQMPETP